MATKTDDKKKGCILQWKIENISYCWLKKIERIESPTFSADAVKGTKWSLRLYPMGHNVEFYLHREKYCTGPKIVDVNYQLAFLDKEGSVLQEVNGSGNHFKRGETGWFLKDESRERIFVIETENFLPGDILSVQCTIWEKGKKPVEMQHLYARTILNVNRRSFMCRIENFSTVTLEQKSVFKDSFIGFDLFLNEGLDFEKQLVLKVNSCKKDMEYFSFKTFIIDSEGKRENWGTQEYFDEDIKSELLFVLFFTRKLEKNKSKYLPNDVLSLDCEFIYSDGTVLYEYCGFGIILDKLAKEDVGSKNETNIRKEEFPNTLDLVHDLKNMYNDAICSNMVLRTSTRTFPAHRGILSARSPVFRSMFNNDMKEKTSGHVDIVDCEDDTIQRMLLYMYTDSLEGLQFESASSLYMIADKYQILSLKHKCSSFLKSRLCSSNACDVLILADQHNDDDLKSAAQDYILEGRKIIFCSPEWKNFMNNHMKLAAVVMYRKICEE